jgi:hypothetical protein
MRARLPMIGAAMRPGRSIARQSARLCVLGMFLLPLAGCADLGIQPWVKPYERNQLADPIMSWGRDQISTAYIGHVRQAREGARGAEGGAGGGCGCN